jgi:AGZA family xanthine/uracil permease-like MFS transporter
MSSVSKIEFHDLEIAIPAFLVIALMPFAYGISDGIGAGLIAYALIKVVKRDWSSLNVFVVIISLLFILKFWMVG